MKRTGRHRSGAHAKKRRARIARRMFHLIFGNQQWFTLGSSRKRIRLRNVGAIVGRPLATRISSPVLLVPATIRVYDASGRIVVPRTRDDLFRPAPPRGSVVPWP